MTAGWRGVITEYRDLLPVTERTPVVTLLEGGTPLVPAPRLSERAGAEVWLKVEGANPTASAVLGDLVVAAKNLSSGGRGATIGALARKAIRPIDEVA